jgi:hypothetical protein
VSERPVILPQLKQQKHKVWEALVADDDKQPAKNLASNGLILAVLIATGAAVYNHMAPLQGARPPVIETPIHQETAIEDVEARLWQDPFVAVAEQYRDQVAKDANDK